jgi:hypothetical protein
MNISQIRFILVIQTVLTFSIYAQDFNFPVTVSDGTVSHDLVLGWDQSGSKNFDPGLDALAPPSPPPGSFDCRYSVNGLEYFTDIRFTGDSIKVWNMLYRPTTGQNIKLYWESDSISALYSIKIANDSLGSLFELDMKTTDSLDVSAYPSISDSLCIVVSRAAGVLADLSCFLQGPFASDTMNTYLQRNALLPLSQPYNGSPWNYSGTETVASVPADVVDWILLELRTGTAAATMVGQRACFVLKDGTVVDTSGVSPLLFEDIADGEYYVVIYHRNHLAIMSASALTLSSIEALSYDFTSDINSVYTTGPAAMTEVAMGVYGLVSGDGNCDNGVDAIDYNTIWVPNNGTPWDYSKFGDFNLDGGIDAIDYNLNWITNNGRGSQVPLGGSDKILNESSKERINEDK